MGATTGSGGRDAGRPGAAGTPGTASSLRSTLLVTGAIGAVVGAGFAVWQRRGRTPTIDPWVAATAPRPGLLDRSSDAGSPQPPGGARPPTT